MNDEYDALSKANDATAFAESRFGKHYMNRLATVRDDHYRKAHSFRQSGQDSLALGELDRASEMDGEIAYLQQAREISSNPNLLKRMADGLRKMKGVE